MGFLDGAVFPHTCDSIQRLSDVWRMNADLGFHLDLALPVKLTGDSARRYMADVFRKFMRELAAALSTEITEADLRRGVETVNRVRALLNRLYWMRSENPSLISGRDLLHVVRGSMMMDRRAVAEHLEKRVASMGTDNGRGVSGNKRLVISGGICSVPDIFDIVAEAGGEVVWDDLCTGSRHVETPVDTQGDILERLAQRYFERVVCPAKHSGLQSRATHLIDIVRRHRADGVIFLFLKFCDPHLFDHPYLAESLEKEGIPNILLEVDSPLPLGQQLKTRCEAFLEML